MAERGSSSQVMRNTQRLSAMIDSLHKEDIEHQLLDISKPENTTFDAHITPPYNKYGSPSKLSRSPAGLISLNSTDNRSSMISDYSGVLHEGVEVSYIVQNQNRERNQQSHPGLPALPSVETLTNHGDKSERNPGAADDLVIKTVANAKPVSRLASSASKGSASSTYSEPHPDALSATNNSLRLLSTNKRHVAPSSVGSGNLASESGSSYYHHIRDEEKEALLPKSENSDGVNAGRSDALSLPTDSSDNMSIATSVIPPLSTSVRDLEEGIKPSRSETNSFNPTIPPRNKNRPSSRIFIRDTLDDIEQQLMEQMRDPVDMQRTSETVTRTSSNTNKSDTYYSATSYQTTDDKDIHSDPDYANKKSDGEYLGRPLPQVPSPLRRDSTLRAKSGQTQDKSRKDYTDNSQFEDEYEDLDETDQQIPDGGSPERTPLKNITKKASNTKSPNRKKNGKKKKQELRSFDIDTLSQLLNVTKGTLIGSEFANLGMKTEEKRALERLVDSLSRLTADMVLDPDRYQEGLKRLDKATKALEGF